MADLILKQVVSVLDDRTTMVCVDAAGQIRPVKLPFDTIAGSFDQPPFHIHCRSISVPWAVGMVSDQRQLANKELRKRPLKDRDKRKFVNTVPPPPSNVNVQAIVTRARKVQYRDPVTGRFAPKPSGASGSEGICRL